MRAASISSMQESLGGEGEVDDGDVGGGDAEGHAGEFAFEPGEHFADGFGGAGGGGDGVAAAARPPRQSFLEGPSTVFWVAV